MIVVEPEHSKKAVGRAGATLLKRARVEKSKGQVFHCVQIERPDPDLLKGNYFNENSILSENREILQPR